MNTGTALPRFTLPSTNGQISFPPEGEWTVLHIYEGDFLPVSATEILALNKAAPKFSAHGARLIAMSADSVASHLAWILSLRNQDKDGKTIDIELISDRFGKTLEGYGMQGQLQSGTLITDPNGILRAYHKRSGAAGINVTEIERELLALQTADAQTGMTPAGWTPGEDIIEPPPATKEQALTNMKDTLARGGYCLDWYICYRQDSGKR